VVNPAGNKPIVPAIPEPARRPVWKGHSLVANNLSAYNGGSGIHTFRTKNVDIVNNTTYWNGQIVGYAELFANASENITIVNNIIVPRPGGKVTVNSTNELEQPEDIDGEKRSKSVLPDRGAFAQ